MGTAIIGPRKVARYRHATGLDIIAAYAPAGTHERKLYLSDGRIAWLQLPIAIQFDDERWSASESEKRAVDNYLAAYWLKVARCSSLAKAPRP